jgi:Na+/H+ antiporter NhaD/arsenite permease-like protein
MASALVVIFVACYLAIALEEPFRINKAGSALVGAGLLWTVYAMANVGHAEVDAQLAESLVQTAQIAFFLMGAMTVVEVIDTHDGFEVITSRIRARTLGSLAWVICLATFFLSAVLDNLTTSIVMISLVRRLLGERDDRLLFAGLIVIAANAGGAWSPMGDVTTTMLWIGGQVTSLAVVKGVIAPSLVNALVPLSIVSWTLRGKPISAPPAADRPAERIGTTPFERNLIFGLGLAVLLAVPGFKAMTHLPPFLGILFGLGVLWIVGDLVHRGKADGVRQHMVIAKALTRIDITAIVFFVGILLAVATLEHSHVLAALAQWLDRTFGRLDLIAAALGLISAVVDNVPMTAAAMGMYDTATHPTDSFLWEFLAYCVGTGGSILIIGSAAGVAAMGIEKIEFIWYARRFGLLAFAGYVGGAVTYIVQYSLIH